MRLTHSLGDENKGVLFWLKRSELDSSEVLPTSIASSEASRPELCQEAASGSA